MGRRGRRGKQLLDHPKEKGSYWNLKEKGTSSKLSGRGSDVSQERLRSGNGGIAS